MKKACISFFGILIIIALIIALPSGQAQTENQYLRIHIRANSNDKDDQSIKYEIKDLVVTYFTPLVENVKSKDDAVKILNSEKRGVNELIDGFLSKKGFSYKSNIIIKEELFPTRVYEDLTLAAGYYDAVIIELGEAKGDNWWCVVYPPLCFMQDKVTYKSYVVDFIKSFFGK